MDQVVWSKYSSAWVRYHFKCRTKNVNLLPYKKKIEQKIEELHGLTPTPQETEFLKKQGYFNESYLSTFSQKQLNCNYVKVTEKNNDLDIEIEGPWHDTIDFEVPILGIVNEVYFEQFHSDLIFREGDRRLDEKIIKLQDIYEEGLKHPERHPFKLMEFGTRRAFSRDWQAHVVSRLKKELPKEIFSGCSNVALAMDNDLVPQGTMAHEYLMAHQAFVPLHMAQIKALYVWNEIYRGKLGIALSDTYTFDQFLRDFDLALASLFSGARHDSGDPFAWGFKLLDHYEKLGINSFTKTGAWTDSLDLDLSYRLWCWFSERIRAVFGIGTNLTNDLGVDPLSIVIKMTHCNGMPLIKISDEPSKAMCEDEKFKEWAIHLFTEMLKS